jgi:hypothetical protein
MHYSKLHIRSPEGLLKHTDGIDFAIWRFYVDIDLPTNDEFNQDQDLSSGLNIPLSDKSLDYLTQISQDTKLTKSEIIRRCLFWLSKQATYPKHYQA